MPHAICYTDSVATRSSVNSDSSDSPQMSYLVGNLREGMERVAAAAVEKTTQLLAVHAPGVRNVGADRLSRGREETTKFFSELAAGSNLPQVEVQFPEHEFVIMREAMHYPQGNKGNKK